MKKFISLCLALSLVSMLLLTACSEQENTEPDLGDISIVFTPAEPGSGTEEEPEDGDSAPDVPPTPEPAPSDIDLKAALEAIMAATHENIPEGSFMPMTLDVEVTSENSQDKLGITSEQFAQHVAEAYTMVAAINTFAFEVTLVQANSGNSAAELKSLVAAGYDPRKWICVFPEQSFVADAGNYLLLGSISNDIADALLDSFAEQFNEYSAGSVNVFYDRGDEVPDEDAGGGMLIAF